MVISASTGATTTFLLWLSLASWIVASEDAPPLGAFLATSPFQVSCLEDEESYDKQPKCCMTSEAAEGGNSQDYFNDYSMGETVYCAAGCRWKEENIPVIGPAIMTCPYSSSFGCQGAQTDNVVTLDTKTFTLGPYFGVASCSEHCTVEPRAIVSEGPAVVECDYVSSYFCRVSSAPEQTLEPTSTNNETGIYTFDIFPPGGNGDSIRCDAEWCEIVQIYLPVQSPALVSCPKTSSCKDSDGDFVTPFVNGTDTDEYWWDSETAFYYCEPGCAVTQGSSTVKFQAPGEASCPTGNAVKCTGVSTAFPGAGTTTYKFNTVDEIRCGDLCTVVEESVTVYGPLQVVCPNTGVKCTVLETEVGGGESASGTTTVYKTIGAATYMCGTSCDIQDSSVTVHGPARVHCEDSIFEDGCININYSEGYYDLDCGRSAICSTKCKTRFAPESGASHLACGTFVAMMVSMVSFRLV